MTDRTLSLTRVDESRLRRWIRSDTTTQRLARRALIIQFLAQGHSPRDVAATLHVSVNTVVRWRDRVARVGVSALSTDAPGRGRKRLPATWETALRDVLQRQPVARRWTVRRIAEALGWTRSTTARRLKQLGLTPIRQ